MIPRETGGVDVVGALGQTHEAELDPRSLPHIINTLTKMYADPILAVIREYTTNGIDAQKEAGYEGPIDIAAPGPLDRNFKVIDHGVGMSHDELLNVFKFYGRSTKRKSDDYVGMIGIGSKSALALVDQFTIKTVKDGELSILACSKNKKGTVEIDVGDPVRTDLPNGTTVAVPIPRDQIGQFNQKLVQYLYFWKPRTYNLVGETVPDREVRFEHELEHEGITLEVSFRNPPTVMQAGYHYRPIPVGNRVKIMMGTTAYDMPMDLTSIDPTLLNSFYDLTNATSGGQTFDRYGNLQNRNVAVNILARCPIGSIELVPNREEIVDCAETKRFLTRLANHAVDWMAEYCAEKIKDYSNLKKMVIIPRAKNSKAVFDKLEQKDPKLFEIKDSEVTISDIKTKASSLKTSNQAAILMDTDKTDKEVRDKIWKTTTYNPYEFNQIIASGSMLNVRGVIYNVGKKMRIVRQDPKYPLITDADKYKEFEKFLDEDPKASYLLLSDEASSIEGIKELFKTERSFDAKGMWTRETFASKAKKTKITASTGVEIEGWTPGPHLLLDLKYTLPQSYGITDKKQFLKDNAHFAVELAMKDVRHALDMASGPVVWIAQHDLNGYDIGSVNMVSLLYSNRFLLSTASSVDKINHPNLVSYRSAKREIPELLKTYTQRDEMMYKAAVCKSQAFMQLTSRTLLRDFPLRGAVVDQITDPDLLWLADIIDFRYNIYNSCNLFSHAPDVKDVKGLALKLENLKDRLEKKYPYLFKNQSELIQKYVIDNQEQNS